MILASFFFNHYYFSTIPYTKQDYNFENRSLKDAYKQAIEYTVLQNKFITLTPAHQSTRHISSNHSNSATTLLILLYMFFDSGRTRMKKTAWEKKKYV